MFKAKPISDQPTLDEPRVRTGLTRNARGKILPAVAAAAVASSGLAMTGCVVAVGTSSDAYYEDEQHDFSVSSFELEHVVAETRGIDLGMDRYEVLDRYDDHLLTKFSTSVIDGREVEEWRVKASHGRKVFQRWLYFVDGELEAFDYHRIEEFTPHGTIEHAEEDHDDSAHADHGEDHHDEG